MPKFDGLIGRMLSTEKSTKAKESQNKYTFVVKGKASQSSVAGEIATKYKVEVENVNLMIVPGKKRRLGKSSKSSRFARTPKWKKAVVLIKEGQKIEEAKEAKKPEKKKETEVK